MLLGVALLTTLVTASPALSTPDGLPNQSSINSFSPLSSAATSQPFINATFIPFPSVQFSAPLLGSATTTQLVTIPQPFTTSIGSIQPSIGSPTSLLGSFTPAIGTTVTTLGIFQPSMGSPITSLGSFAPSSGVPFVTLGSSQPGIGSPTTMLGSFQPGIGALQPNFILVSANAVTPVLVTPVIPVTVASTDGMSIPVSAANGIFVPFTTTAINLALTNGQLTVLDPTDSSSSHIMNHLRFCYLERHSAGSRS